MRTAMMIVGMSTLVLSACTQESKQAGRTSGPMTDAQLEDKVKKGLEAEPALQQTLLSVKADSQRNQVTLSGTVMTESQRSRALEIASAMQPDVIVTDQIEVRSEDVPLSEYTDEMSREARAKAKNFGDKIGDSLQDAWIHTKIVAKLVAAPNTPQRKINVDVVSGVVTLRGKVPTAQARAEAERIARNTAAVRRVENMLTLEPAET